MAKPQQKISNTLQFRCGNLMFDGDLFSHDSLDIPKFCSQAGLDTLDAFKEELPWKRRGDRWMKYRNNELARSKAFLVKDVENLAKYGYPGFTYPSMEYYRACRMSGDVAPVALLVHVLEGHCQYKYAGGEWTSPVINHVIGTEYESGTDNIGFHSDKVKDLEPGAPTFILSVGGERELHFVDAASGHFLKSFVMKSGSLFILGPQTNVATKHALVAVEDEVLLDKTRVVEPRISVIGRHIRTVVSRAELERRVAKSKRDAEARRAAKTEKRKSDKEKRKRVEKKPRTENEKPKKRKREVEKKPKKKKAGR